MAHHRVVEELTRLGGCATRLQLDHVVSARRISRALRCGEIVRLRRGLYALPIADEHRRAAHELTAVVSRLSAAAAHGWAVKTPPQTPWVTVRRKRHLGADVRSTVVAVWADLDHTEVAEGVTTPLRTVVDCARRLPFDEALAVADSALRARDVTSEQLRTATRHLRGPGAPQARRVARHATDLAANPFESVLRAIVLDLAELGVTREDAWAADRPELRLVQAVGRLSVRAQLPVWDRGLWARVDLGDEGLKLALEAEGFAAHSSRSDLLRDCHRYTELSVWGWTVLRFAWEDVHAPPRLRAVGDRRLARAARRAPGAGHPGPVAPARGVSGRTDRQSRAGGAPYRDEAGYRAASACWCVRPDARVPRPWVGGAAHRRVWG